MLTLKLIAESFLIELRRFRYLCWTVFVSDFDMILYHVRRKRFRKLWSYIWSRFRVRDIGGGFLDSLYRRYPRLAPYPKEIEIEITTRCHLRCIMCERNYWDDRSYARRDMTFEQFRRICEQFPDLKFIGIAGEGTCFLHKDFIGMLEYLDRRNVFVLLIDSFDTLDEHRSRKLIELGMHRVEASLDAATRETYETIRKGARWDSVIANLQTLRRLKVEMRSSFPDIFFRYVLTKLNLGELPDFIQLVADLDMNVGRPTVVQVAGLLVFDKIRDLEVKEIPTALVDRAHAKAREVGVVLNWSHTPNSMPPMQVCTKWLQPYVIIDGDVVLDCAVMMWDNREFLKCIRLGNLLCSDFKSVWNDPRYRRIRESVNRDAGPVSVFCKDCRGYDTSSRQQKYGVFE